jgi:hypothetical protein
MEWLMAFSEVVYIYQEKSFCSGWQVYTHIYSKSLTAGKEQLLLDLSSMLLLRYINKAKTDLSAYFF